jgi:hypothetical protein
MKTTTPKPKANHSGGARVRVIAGRTRRARRCRQHHRHAGAENGERHGAAHRPVEAQRELLLDEVADHRRVGAPDEARRHIVAGRHQERQRERRQGAGARHRKDDVAEGLTGPGADIARRFDRLVIDRPQRAIDRQDGERQQEVGQRDHHGARVVDEDRQRLAHDPEPQQGGIQDAILAEDALPGIDLDQVAAEQRQQGDKQERRAEASSLEADQVGEGKGDGRGQDRRRQCDPQGDGDDAGILLPGLHVVIEREVGHQPHPLLAPEAHGEEEGYGRDEQSDEHDRRRSREEPASQVASECDGRSPRLPTAGPGDVVSQDLNVLVCAHASTDSPQGPHPGWVEG